MLIRGPFFISLGLHVLVCVAMVWASGARTMKATGLPAATIVKLVRPIAPQGSGGIPKLAKEGQLPESNPPKFPTKQPKNQPKVSEPDKPISKVPNATKSSGPVGGGGKELKGEAGTLSVQGSGFEYDFYLSVVQSKIEQNFRPPPGLRASSMSTVSFTIQKSGVITDVNLAKSSGNLLIDQAAVRAIRAAGQFPPLPSQYEKGTLEIYFEFVVNSASRP